MRSSLLNICTISNIHDIFREFSENFALVADDDPMLYCQIGARSPPTGQGWELQLQFRLKMMEDLQIFQSLLMTEHFRLKRPLARIQKNISNSQSSPQQFD